MTERSLFDRLGTPAKLLFALSLVMLPIGGALIWGAQRNLDTANQTLAETAGQRAQLSVRAIESLIARNALALRVAANTAVRESGADACVEAVRGLAVAPGVARQFEIEDAAGRPICSVGDFSDLTQPPRTLPGLIGLWIAENERSLLVRTGVDGGSATARLTADELRAALRSEGGMFTAASLDDGRKRIMLIGSNAPSAFDDGSYRKRMAIGGGRRPASRQSWCCRWSTAC